MKIAAIFAITAKAMSVSTADGGSLVKLGWFCYKLQEVTLVVRFPEKYRKCPISHEMIKLKIGQIRYLFERFAKNCSTKVKFGTFPTTF